MKVNGLVSTDRSRRVSLESDRIGVDGRIATQPKEPVVIALHKPVGTLTTRSDPQGRPTVYSLLPGLDRFVFPVGRLDRESSGLLIFTDDHRLGEVLTNPQSHLLKIYEVVVDALPDRSQLAALRAGIDIGKGEVTRPAKVEILTPKTGGASLRISIDEGKNRQIRRMMSAVGLSVLELCRTAIGGYEMKDIPEGGHRFLRAEDREHLLRRR